MGVTDVSTPQRRVCVIVVMMTPGMERKEGRGREEERSVKTKKLIAMQ
jgi:hypothetical protein